MATAGPEQTGASPGFKPRQASSTMMSFFSLNWNVFVSNKNTFALNRLVFSGW